MKKYKFFPLLITIFVAIISIVSISISLAKYVTNKKSSTVIKPDEFIFESNYKNNETYNIYTTSFTFLVKNKDALENKNSTDINYKITVDNLTNDSVADKVSNHTLLQSKDNNEHTINELVVGNKYQIIIESTSPIKKTITYFVNVLESTIESYYSITDHDSYIVVDIYIGNTVTGKVTINYNNSKVLPDNLNILMEKWFTNTGTITVSNNSHYELIFFKTDNTNFNKLKTIISGNNVTINIGL